MFRLPALLMLAGFAASAADAVSAETILLQRARYHMATMLTNLPNYTCLQTIERSFRSSPKRKPSLLDVVRIEVALVNGKELFSWPGSGRFVDTEISQMVQGGAIGTGSFALHARAVFQGRVATYKYEGVEQMRGRKVHKWTFKVPRTQSGFLLRDGVNEAVVGYSGAFWIEAATMDAVRLEVRSDDIPATLRIASTSDIVDYVRTRIGAQDFLLPTLSELVMVDNGGAENNNRTTFTGCRQYGTESTLLFDDPAPESLIAKAAEPPRNLVAPPKLVLEFDLKTAVNLRNAAVGDPLTGALSKPVKLPDGTVLPKGTLVHGRLTYLRPTALARYQVLAVGMKFVELESGNTRVRIGAALQSIQTPGQEFVNRPGSAAFNMPVPENETILGSIIFVREYTSQLRRGLRMIWLTTKPNNEDDSQ